MAYKYGTAATGELQDSDSFTYTICDGYGGTPTATVSVGIVVHTLQ